MFCMSRRRGSSGSSSSDMPLIAPRTVERPTLLAAALRARRQLVAIEAQPDAPNVSADVADAATLIIMQLRGLAECVGSMASTGLLHLDVDADSLQTRSTPLPEGGWTSTTMVLTMPSAVSRDATLDPAVCYAMMNALVVFSVVAADASRELVEFRPMAAMLAQDWPVVDEGFESLLRAAWELRYDPQSERREFPRGRLAHAASARIHAAALATGVPLELERASTSASDFARRTLAWIGEPSLAPNNITNAT